MRKGKKEETTIVLWNGVHPHESTEVFAIGAQTSFKVRNISLGSLGRGTAPPHHEVTGFTGNVKEAFYPPGGGSETSKDSLNVDTRLFLAFLHQQTSSSSPTHRLCAHSEHCK